MPDSITASGPSSLAASSILNSLIVTGSGNMINFSSDAFARSEEARNYLRLLVVIAAPVAAADGVNTPLSPPLDVWGEWERLRASLDGPIDPVEGIAAAWAVVRLAEPTPERLRDALATGPGYHAVHFICHGNSEGILLEDRLGCERFVPTAQLVNLLRGDGDRPAPALVIFNACETRPVAEAAVSGKAAVAALATCQPIFDLEAKLLAERLYRRLGGGATVGAALAEFRRTLTERLRGGDLPGLGDPDQRAANVILVGDGSLRLQAEPPPASRPRFVLDVAQHNEPLPLHLVHGFVGRAAEQVMIARWLRRDGAAVFALSGPGGMGKTSLALSAALHHSHRFAALAFAGAKGIPDFGPLQVALALSEALNWPLAAEESGNLAGAITKRLNSERPVLLLLDNLESVAPVRAAELARAVSGMDPRCGSRIIMTLRPYERDPLTALAHGDRLVLNRLDRASALRLAWEEADGLHLDLADAVASGPLSPPQAHELEDVRRRAWLRWLPLPQVAALDELAALAFRHPALIEGAVRTWGRHGWSRMLARLAALQGKEIADALDEFIGQMADDLAARAPAGLALLYAALPFAGGADEAHLRFVALGADVAGDSPAAITFEDEALAPAVASGLLRGVGGRYDLDAPVRAYLEARRPADPADRRTLEIRHAAAFVPVVAEYDDLLERGLMTYSAPREWTNVTAAFDRLAASAPADDAAARTLVACARGWRNTLYNNHDPRRLGWLDAAVAAAQRVGDRSDQANVLQAQGDVLAFQKQNGEALARYEAALGLFRAVGDRLGEANVLKAQGDVLRRQGENEPAGSRYQSALTLYQQTGSRQGEANAYLGLGRLALAEGRHAEARQWVEKAVALHAANQSRYDVALDYETLAQALSGDGDIESADSALRQSAANYIEIGLQDRAASALTTLASILDDAGRQDEALLVHASIVALQPDEAMWRRNYADGLIKMGSLDNAGVQLDAAEALDPTSPYLALRRAELAQARGDRKAAIRWAQEALRRQPGWDEAEKILQGGETTEPNGC